jgi:tudor domain-containing protein 1/4/6/7
VVGVEGGSCVVFFVDYGNKDTVPLSNMAVCPPQLISLPLVVLRCALDGINSIQPAEYDAVVSFLRKHAVDHLFSASVAELGATPTLNFRDGEGSLSDKMIKEGVVVPPVLPQQLPMVCRVPRMSLPPEVFQAMVTEVVSPQELFLQVVTQEVAVLLSEVAGIDAAFESSPPAPFLSLPAVGSLCCARFSVDSKWYRVEVLDVKDTNDITVVFLDYGNKEHVLLSSLAICPPQYAALPIIAVQCSLGGLAPPLVVSEDQVTNFLKQKACNVVLSARVLDKVGGIPSVELKNENGVSLVSELTKLGFVASPCALASDLTILKFPESGGSFKAMVFEVVSLSELYVHLHMDETATTMDEITDAINANFKTRPKSLTSPPVVGALYLAKFLEDDSWCRAQVVAVKGNRCKVFFVDYGNIGIVQLSDIVACSPELAAFPRIAIKCALSNVPSEYIQSEKHISKLKELTGNCVVSAKFVCERDGVPHIDILRLKGDTNILTELGLLSAELSAPLVADMKKNSFPDTGGPFGVLVCELVGPQELYVQVYNDETVKALSTLVDGLAAFFGSGSVESLVTPPTVGSLCCAKFSQDNVWYRVRVDAVSKSKCKVFFVDFGNSEEVELNDMAACPPEFRTLPVLAIRCALYGMNDYKWSSQALDILREFTVNHLLEASIVSDSNQTSPVVQLVNKSDGTLVSAKFEEKYRSTVSSLIPLRRCQVSEINSPSSFYIQYVEQENVGHFSTLKVLQTMYADPTVYMNFEPSVGALCCAQYCVDKLWYRCEVLSLSKQAVRLLYIDFGSVCNVLRSNVYRLDEKFAKFPPLALHCTLEGVKPVSAEGWSEEACAKFQKICDGVVVFTSGSTGDPRVVRLYKDANSEGSVADTLISNGLGVRC